MKAIKLSILFLVQILFLSCSEQVYVDGTSKQVIKRDKIITPVSYTHLTLPTICSV